MTPALEERINTLISARLPKNWSFNFVLDEDEVLLLFNSPKTSIRIITPIPKDFNDNPVEAIEKIILKYINGRFYK